MPLEQLRRLLRPHKHNKRPQALKFLLQPLFPVNATPHKLVLFFWILPSDAPSTDEMAGWTLVESDRDIPTGFCFSSQLAVIPCQSSFFSFGALSTYGGNGTLFASGETQAGGVVKFSTKFSTSALHRYALTGTNMIFSNKKRDAYWAINATTGQIAMVPQAKASKFTMYKRSNGQGPILLKSGSRFVALSITGMYASQAVTTEHLFLPPQQQYESTVVDTMDVELMGYRVNALSNGGKLSPAWMAYDLALVIPLRDQPKGPQFTQFRMNQAGTIDLSPMFSKFFRLVANKMVKEYGHYPSLGRHLPQDLMLHQVAEGIKTQRADVWPSVARTFVKTVPLPDTTLMWPNYASNSGSASIVLESRPQSNLGPGMHGKTYLIEPVKYKTEYTYGGGFVSSAVVFSEWVITAKVEGSGGSAPRIGYRKASTPLLLQAQVQLDRMPITPPISSTTSDSLTSSSVGLPTTASASSSVPMASTGGNLSPSAVSTSLNNSPSSQRRLRHAVVEAGSILVGEPAIRKGGSNTSCCSQTTEYRVLVDGRYDCVSCPKGSISQLGGLYCIPDPRQSQ